MVYVDEINIVFHRNLALALIGGALVSSLMFNVIFTICLLGIIAFVIYQYSPSRGKWIKEPLVIFKLCKEGISLYPYGNKIPWSDIQAYSINYEYFRFYLKLDIQKDKHMTEEKRNFYTRLQQDNLLDRTGEHWTINYPYILIKCELEELKKHMNTYLKEYSSNYTMERELQVSKSPVNYYVYIGIGLLFINLIFQNAMVFLLTFIIGAVAAVYFYFSTKYTSYIVFTKESFELPYRSLRFSWKDIKLVEIIDPGRNSFGKLVIWFNDFQSYTEKNPHLLHNEYILNSDDESLMKTGRVELHCTTTSLSTIELREIFHSYIDKYGLNSSKHNVKDCEIKSDYYEIEPGKAIEHELNQIQVKNEIIEEGRQVSKDSNKEQDELIENNAVMDIETNKFVKVYLKAEDEPQDMVILKEVDKYYFAIKVVGFQLNGYSIFLKEQIKRINYYPDFYNDMLQKEYYFKLNSIQNIDLSSWKSICDSYYIRNQFIEIKTSNNNAIGVIENLIEGTIKFKEFDIKEGLGSEQIAVDMNTLQSLTYDTAELSLIKKYS